MRLFSSIVIALCVVLSACQPGDPAQTPSQAPATTVQTADPPRPDAEHTVAFTRSGLSVEFPYPPGWDFFTTEHGVVIAEKFGSVADRGELHGLLAYVFVTPMDEFPFAVDRSPGHSIAAQVLSGIAADPEGNGAAHVSGVVSFTWAGYDAAYYLFTEPDTGLRTIVIGMSLPEHDLLLTCALSAPHQSAGRIRPALPLLLSGLTLNTQAVSADDLNTLPERLDFPE